VQITVIVINWNLKAATIECLRSVERLDPPCRIIVVDNGSEDGSAECIAGHFPQAELFALPANIGFAAACNRAISRALVDDGCQFVLLLNNDAVIHPNALWELVQAATQHPGAGILGPKVYSSHRQDLIWYAGARRRRLVLAAADTGRGQLDRGQFNALRAVDYVFGAAMLIRRSVFERIGLFDERFFLYLEDLDFCLRAQAAGFTLLFVPQACVWHTGSASTTNNVMLRKYHLTKSTVHFLQKYTSLCLSLPVLGFWLLVAARTIIAELARGNTPAIRSYWLGLVNGLAEIRRV
jgi:GT2 family glycosyltransferase